MTFQLHATNIQIICLSYFSIAPWLVSLKIQELPGKSSSVLGFTQVSRYSLRTHWADTGVSCVLGPYPHNPKECVLLYYLHCFYKDSKRGTARRLVGDIRAQAWIQHVFQTSQSPKQLLPSVADNMEGCIATQFLTILHIYSIIYLSILLATTSALHVYWISLKISKQITILEIRTLSNGQDELTEMIQY